MYSISKEFSFSAAHRLGGLPHDHPCSNLHGHNYIVKLTISCTKLDDNGFVVDYSKLNWFKELIDNTYDHKYLNDIVNFNPTAENLADSFVKILADWLNREYSGRLILVAAGVSETPKTWAWSDIGYDDYDDTKDE